MNLETSGSLDTVVVISANHLRIYTLMEMKELMSSYTNTLYIKFQLL